MKVDTEDFRNINETAESRTAWETAKREKREERIRQSDPQRDGNVITITPNYQAIQGREGDMLTLEIQHDGKCLTTYRGNSLIFSAPLDTEDKAYIRSLAIRAITG